ncbi:MAG: hypothetical protein ACO2ZA_07220, partial [Litorivicinaceae bacterium]
MASSKTAYVAFGGDASIGFAGDEVLNRPSSRALDDPPWKVFDSDVQFEPMFVEGYAPAAEADVAALESTDTVHAEDAGPHATDDSGETSDKSDSDDPEWAEVADHLPEIMGVTEAEILARIEEAVAATKAELMTAHSQQVSELEDTITA